MYVPLHSLWTYFVLGESVSGKERPTLHSGSAAAAAGAVLLVGESPETSTGFEKDPPYKATDGGRGEAGCG